MGTPKRKLRSWLYIVGALLVIGGLIVLWVGLKHGRMPKLSADLYKIGLPVGAIVAAKLFFEPKYSRMFAEAGACLYIAIVLTVVMVHHRVHRPELYIINWVVLGFVSASMLQKGGPPPAIIDPEHYRRIDDPEPEPKSSRSQGFFEGVGIGYSEEGWHHTSPLKEDEHKRAHRNYRDHCHDRFHINIFSAVNVHGTTQSHISDASADLHFHDQTILS